MTMLPRVFGIRRVCSHLWLAAGFWAVERCALDRSKTLKSWGEQCTAAY